MSQKMETPYLSVYFLNKCWKPNSGGKGVSARLKDGFLFVTEIIVVKK